VLKLKYLCGDVTGKHNIPAKVATEAIKPALRYDEKEQVGNQPNDLDRDELWGAMMVGAMQELQHRFGTKKRGNKS
jgi:hypothetical protein